VGDESLSGAAAVTDIPSFTLKGAYGNPAAVEPNYALVHTVFKRIKYTPIKFLPLFFGGNGVEHCSWTGGTAIDAIYPHRIFRELLKVWTGWDATGIDYVEVNGTDWSGSTIDSNRNWLVRWFTGLESKSLQQVIDALQYQGCFIWIFDETSSGREARIVYVKQSSDFQATLDGDDLSSVKMGHTPVSQIVSKRIANYNRQTITGEYADQNTKTNSNRADWNFATEENIVEDDLDFLTASADVDSFLSYYDNIDGEPKITIAATIEDPQFWNLQEGDRVKFTNLEINPFGFSLGDYEFMITKIVEKPGSFSIFTRLVFDSGGAP
jgi:hypothetical protein